MNITDRQAKILQFMREFHATEDRLPSSREIADHLGFKHQTAVVNHLRRLVAKGLIEHRRPEGRKNGWHRFPRS